MTLMGDEPEIGLGDSGEHVMGLQDRLRGLGLLTKQPDGSYDDATESAVRQLQSNLGHDNDGRVTPDTWQALDQHMLSNGLQYNHYAGPGNQHWDQPQDAGGDWGQVGADGQAHAGQDDWSQAHGQDAWGQEYAGQGEGSEAHAGGAQDGEVTTGSLSPDGSWRWNGTDWEAAHGTDGQAHAGQDYASEAHAGGAQDGEVTIGSLSPDGLWKWNGNDWEAAHGAAEPAPEGEQETPVIPHIDNIHPAIAGDERFSSFHDFLRDNAPAK